jgi:hypothetical protein
MFKERRKLKDYAEENKRKKKLEKMETTVSLSCEDATGYGVADRDVG